MTLQLSCEQVWEAIEKESFAVLGMVTKKNQSRTVGTNYTVSNRKLYSGTVEQAWKTRHVKANPNVSITIPIAKRIPFLPWIKIPAATITFSGTARVLDTTEVSPDILQALYSKVADDEEMMATYCLIEITPQKDFITYGVGMPLIQMRDPKKARGRVAVG